MASQADLGNKSADPRRRKLRRPHRAIFFLLLVWLVVGGSGAITYQQELGSLWHATRVDRPVVLFDSDNWGGAGLPVDSGLALADLDTRQAEAVRQVTEILRRHQDSAGRHPVVNAFVVIATPDAAAMQADPTGAYHWQPIDRTMPQLVAALKKAESEGLMTISYRGRDYLGAGQWPKPGRDTFVEHPVGGAESVAGAAAAADGIDYLEPPPGSGSASAPAATIDAKVSRGLAEFQRIFGHPALSTLAPQDIWNPLVSAAWRKYGIRYVHGINYQSVDGGSRDTAVASRKFGYRSPAGLLGVPRDAALDLKLNGSVEELDRVLSKPRVRLAYGQPAVIAVNADNFLQHTPEQRALLAERFDQLLTSLEQSHAKLVYLSAEQLGLLGESGALRLAGQSGRPPAEIRTVGGLRDVGLFILASHYYGLKVKVWFWGIALLGVAFVAAWLRQKRLDRQRLQTDKEEL